MRLTTLITGSLCLAALALPAAASASSTQLSIFQADNELVHSGDGKRQETLAELQRLGVDVIKFQLTWATVAGEGKSRPTGFDGRDPGEYGGWSRYDAFVSDAQSRGFRVMATLDGPAPGWATRKRGDSAGAYRPSSRYFGRFAEAAGKRYPGIDLWSFWNEPNHKGYLAPQAVGSRPYAPHLYRSLVRAGVAGLHRAGHSRSTILFGELLPVAGPRISKNSNMRPLVFLREFFCVDRSFRAFGGRSARLRGCQRYKRLTGVDGFAYHPYSRGPQGPRWIEGSPDSATIRSLSRVTRALDRARAKRRIGGGRLPLWNTEFGFQSDPPDDVWGAKLSQIPGFLNESEWMTFRNRRVASYSQYTLVDTPLGPGGDTGTWQAGLYFSNGRVKSGVYQAYRLPIFVRLLGPSAVEVWGAARPGGPGATVQVQQKARRRGWANLGSAISVGNRRGYFTQRFRISSAARRKYRFTYSGLTSRDAKAAVR